MVTDYTDIVARFNDKVAAETLASFIAAAGIPCDVVDVSDPMRLECCAVRVQRSRISDLRQALDLKPVANRLNSAAAQVIAGRLARENVPCYIGGGHTYGVLIPGGDSDVPIRETSESGFMVAVPAQLVRAALRILNVAPISEEELTKLALADYQSPEDLP
jgi:hypothetical protein